MSVLKNKIISNDKDLIGIVFFGTVSISQMHKLYEKSCQCFKTKVKGENLGNFKENKVTGNQCTVHGVF